MNQEKRNRYASSLATSITGKRWADPQYQAIRSMLVGLQARGIMFDSLGPPPSIAEVEAAWQAASDSPTA